MRFLPTLLTAALVIFLTGCDDLTAPPSSTPTATESPSTLPAHDHGANETDESDSGDADADQVSGAETPEVEREVAEVGVGKKGRGYGGGVVSEPIRAMFRTEQRLQLMQMTHALQLYKGEHGYLPKSHEIFMKDIIEANSIQLPELPEGERYVYDPQQGELMVERPAP